jgi:hypothetical protein
MAGHAARIWERKGAYGVMVGNPKDRNHLEDLCVNERIILKWTLNK